MEIRVAIQDDTAEITALYERSQSVTHLLNPHLISPNELGDHLYKREAIERYVAVQAGRIIGHGLIEEPNHLHIPLWKQNLTNKHVRLIEMGGAFVEPHLSGLGIWRALLQHRLGIIRNLEAIPVTATWSQNEHVKKILKLYGGSETGTRPTPNGDVSLFAFELR